jgi:hypothetical protein
VTSGEARVCEDPDEAIDAGPLDADAVTDAGIDAGPPSDAGPPTSGWEFAEAHTCAADVECAAGEVCAIPIMSRFAQRICRRTCTTDADCADLPGLSWCLLFQNMDRADAQFCTHPCDPLSGGGCPPGDTCDLYSGDRPDGDGGTSAFSYANCRAAGAVGIGAPCDSVTHTAECAPGLTCVYVDFPAMSEVPHCSPLCAPAGTPGGCPSGLGCDEYPSHPIADALEIGFCDVDAPATP